MVYMCTLILSVTIQSNTSIYSLTVMTVQEICPGIKVHARDTKSDAAATYMFTQLVEQNGRSTRCGRHVFFITHVARTACRP